MRHLLEDEVNAFLDARSTWMALTTVGPDGFPHTVPLGYFRLDGDIYLGCRQGTQKLRNIERNPQVSLMIESGRSTGDIKGVLIQGLASIVSDDAERLRLAQAAARLRGTAEPGQVSPGSAYIRVQPRKVVSWDFSPPQESQAGR